MEKRASFVICGTQKSGTTALADQLRLHPRLCIPAQKELHFFDDESQTWPNPDYNAYHSLFDDGSEQVRWGEATPIYMYWDAAPERIWRYNPEMRLIVILRNPISRAYSHWAMERQRGAESLDFASALSLEEERCLEARPLQHRVFSYKDRGFYCHQLRRLWRLFGREAVLVLRQEELRQEPQATLNRVCDHLGVERIKADEKMERHVGSYPEPMPTHLHEQLRQVFWHEICQLEALLDWDCQEWLKKQ
jgi:hypothetical protein